MREGVESLGFIRVAVRKVTVLIERGVVVDCILHVDSDEFILGIPVAKKAVAMARLPKGSRTIELPREL